MKIMSLDEVSLFCLRYACSERETMWCDIVWVWLVVAFGASQRQKSLLPRCSHQILRALSFIVRPSCAVSRENEKSKSQTCIGRLHCYWFHKRYWNARYLPAWERTCYVLFSVVIRILSSWLPWKTVIRLWERGRGVEFCESISWPFVPTPMLTGCRRSDAL